LAPLNIVPFIYMKGAVCFLYLIYSSSFAKESKPFFKVFIGIGFGILGVKGARVFIWAIPLEELDLINYLGLSATLDVLRGILFNTT